MSKISVPLQAGLDAYNRGDYDTALREFLPLANQGDATAQFFLGVLSAEGQRVPQDDQEAVRWYRLAAEQDFALAQNNLGRMFFTGQGVSRNLVRAYMWASLAAAQGHEQAAKGLEMLEEEMSQSQVAEAQRLAQEWNAKREE